MTDPLDLAALRRGAHLEQLLRAAVDASPRPPGAARLVVGVVRDVLDGRPFDEALDHALTSWENATQNPGARWEQEAAARDRFRAHVITSVACPFCHAERGAPCVATGSGQRKSEPHAGRRDLALAARERAAKAGAAPHVAD